MVTGKHLFQTVLRFLLEEGEWSDLGTSLCNHKLRKHSHPPPPPANVKAVFSPCAHLQEQLSEVLDAMFEKVVKADEHVIDQGDDGDNFYVIER